MCKCAEEKRSDSAEVSIQVDPSPTENAASARTQPHVTSHTAHRKIGRQQLVPVQVEDYPESIVRFQATHG